MQEKWNHQPNSSPWISFIGCAQTRQPSNGHAQCFIHQSITRARISSFETGFGSDTNQCTSQVNPGEIEIHLQNSDHNQWRRNHMEAALPSASKTQGRDTMGDNCAGESRGDYISDSACRSVGGAGGAQDRTQGVKFREQTRTDRG